MKKSKTNYYKLILEELQELKKRYPSFSMGRHLATALDEYGDLWGVSDKEIHFAVKKYKAQMEMDVPIEADEKEIDRIIEDGMNLNSILDEDDEDY